MDGQLFISEPDLRYLVDSSKNRASNSDCCTQHTVTLPVSATLMPLFVYHFALWIEPSCAAGLSWTYDRRQCLMCGQWPHLRKEERRFVYLFLSSHKSNGCLRSSFHTASHWQCRGLSDGTKEVAFPFHRLTALYSWRC